MRKTTTFFIILIILLVIVLLTFIPENKIEDSKGIEPPQERVEQVPEETPTIQPIETNYEGPAPKDIYTVKEDTRGTVTFRRVTVNGQEIPFRYAPEEVQDIPFPQDLSQLNSKSIVYVTRAHSLEAQTDDLSSIAAIEFGRFVQNTVASFTTPNQATIENNIPVKTCQDTTPTEGVILMTLGASTKIYFEGGCLVLQAKNKNDLVRAADKLAFIQLGIY